MTPHLLFAGTFTGLLALGALLAAPAHAGGGMNCGFGTWESPDETVRLFPTYAVVDAKNPKRVRVPVHVWVHERERDRLRRAAIRALAGGIGVKRGTPERGVFDERMVDFMVDNERGKAIKVWVGGAGLVPVEGRLIGTTPANGHVVAVVEVQLASARAPASLRLTIGVDEKPPPLSQMIEVPIVSARGVTVVSDIDDTIKVTNVLDRGELVANTFTRPFRPVPGMKALFDGWAEEGARFHYLSASPWNLQAALQRFATEHDFPSGVYHLRILRLKDMDNVVDFVSESRAHKLASLRTLMKDFPSRAFILVGDSGEKDPEIYGEIAREHPERVREIVIRRVEGAANDEARFAKAFAGVPTTLWSVVDLPEEEAPASAPAPAPSP